MVVRGRCDVGLIVVMFVLGVVTLDVVVVGLGVLVLVILQSTSQGQLQTSNSGSKYNWPVVVFGHKNK